MHKASCHQASSNTLQYDCWTSRSPPPASASDHWQLTRAARRHSKIVLDHIDAFMFSFRLGRLFFLEATKLGDLLQLRCGKTDVLGCAAPDVHGGLCMQPPQKLPHARHTSPQWRPSCTQPHLLTYARSAASQDPIKEAAYKSPESGRGMKSGEIELCSDSPDLLEGVRASQRHTSLDNRAAGSQDEEEVVGLGADALVGRTWRQVRIMCEQLQHQEVHRRRQRRQRRGHECQQGHRLRAHGWISLRHLLRTHFQNAPRLLPCPSGSRCITVLRHSSVTIKTEAHEPTLRPRESAAASMLERCRATQPAASECALPTAPSSPVQQNSSAHTWPRKPTQRQAQRRARIRCAEFSGCANCSISVQRWSLSRFISTARASLMLQVCRNRVGEGCTLAMGTS